ncbi:MAG TPA: OmpA family protein [Humisphaera sp.]
MHSLLAVFGLSVVGLGTGCVSQERFAATRMQADANRTQLDAAQAEVNSSKATKEVLQAQLEKAHQTQEGQQAIINNQAAQITELTRQNEQLNGQYQLAIANMGKVGTTALPPHLLSELSAFAQQNPDVVDFDDKKGLVKFKSDVTFSVGSDVVKPEVKAVIDRLAGILNGPTASQYELAVIGHTDSDKVSNAATIKAGHRDNWYLSAHRAIAVAAELRQQGVAANRMQVAGVADTKPVAPNDTAGKAKNRRVEVYILPTTAGTTPPPAAPSAPVATNKPTGTPTKRAGSGLNKDAVPSTVELDKRPALPINK